MDNPEIDSKELTEKQPETRKRKLLTASVILWVKCKVCLEPGNLENMVRHQLPVKDSRGIELYQAFEYVYFCSESCKGMFV